MFASFPLPFSGPLRRQLTSGLKQASASGSSSLTSDGEEQEESIVTVAVNHEIHLCFDSSIDTVWAEQYERFTATNVEGLKGVTAFVGVIATTATYLQLKQRERKSVQSRHSRVEKPHGLVDVAADMVLKASQKRRKEMESQAGKVVAENEQTTAEVLTTDIENFVCSLCEDLSKEPCSIVELVRQVLVALGLALFPGMHPTFLDVSFVYPQLDTIDAPWKIDQTSDTGNLWSLLGNLLAQAKTSTVVVASLKNALLKCVSFIILQSFNNADALGAHLAFMEVHRIVAERAIGEDRVIEGISKIVVELSTLADTVAAGTSAHFELSLPFPLPVIRQGGISIPQKNASAFRELMTELLLIEDGEAASTFIQLCRSSSSQLVESYLDDIEQRRLHEVEKMKRQTQGQKASKKPESEGGNSESSRTTSIDRSTDDDSDDVSHFLSEGERAEFEMELAHKLVEEKKLVVVTNQSNTSTPMKSENKHPQEARPMSSATVARPSSTASSRLSPAPISANVGKYLLNGRRARVPSASILRSRYEKIRSQTAVAGSQDGTIGANISQSPKTTNKNEPDHSSPSRLSRPATPSGFLRDSSSILVSWMATSPERRPPSALSTAQHGNRSTTQSPKLNNRGTCTPTAEATEARQHRTVISPVQCPSRKPLNRPSSSFNTSGRAGFLSTSFVSPSVAAIPPTQTPDINPQLPQDPKVLPPTAVSESWTKLHWKEYADFYHFTQQRTMTEDDRRKLQTVFPKFWIGVRHVGDVEPTVKVARPFETKNRKFV